MSDLQDKSTLDLYGDAHVIRICLIGESKGCEKMKSELIEIQDELIERLRKKSLDLEGVIFKKNEAIKKLKG